MRITADENVDAPLIRWLRDSGNDVLSVAEACSGIDDESVLREAFEQQRIVLTFDRDFGGLVFRRKVSTHGVVLLRLSTSSPEGLLQSFKSAWPIIEARAEGRFLVVTAHGVRMRPLPNAAS